MDRKRDAQDDLRTTTEANRADARRVHEIEEQKSELAPDDPRVDELSHEAARVADRLQRTTRIEEDLAAEIDAPSDDGARLTN